MSRVVTTPPVGAAAPDGTRPAGWWHETDETDQPARIVCDLCPRACTLRPGDKGFCFVRESREGRLVSTTYGRSTGFCVDPVEKKPLNHFYPGTPILSFGTAGCNLGCKFCQNWTSSRSRDVRAACEVAAPETIAAAAAELDCRSVAFTYNDPVIFAEYAIDTARACRAAGVKTVAVTSGYITGTARADFFGEMDAANVDLKAITDEFYRQYCAARLQPVLDTLGWLVHETDVWVEITNLIIPGANDSPAEIERLCRWVFDELGPDVPLHFTAFHPDFKMTDRGPTPRTTLTEAHDTARAVGLRYVYTGNLSDPERQCTYCPGCGRMVIERDGYRLGAYAIHGGRCAHCETPIAGRFDGEPGTWGGRRLPVRIADYVREPHNPPSPEDGSVSDRSSNAPESGSESQPNASPESRSETAPEAPGRPVLSPDQEQQVLRAAARRVAATVQGQAPEPLGPLLGDAAGVPLYGAFVSLKRAGQLRSCCGYLAQSLPLSEAVDRAAERAARDDPRFPPISATELGHLDMEVWLLWNLQPIRARGEDRVRAVTIGKHGLQIARGGARGLLLPGVATEHNLDAQGFLDQVCLKAGLPAGAWKADDATVMTFEGYAISGRLPVEETSEAAPVPVTGPSRDQVAALAEFCRGNLAALSFGATPSYYMPGGYDGSLAGVTLVVTPAGTGEAIQVSRLTVRPELPLQSTLFGLTEAAARALRQRGVEPVALQGAHVALGLLADPAMHGTADGPELDGVDPRHRAVLASDGSRFAWVYDPQKTAGELLEEALAAAKLSDPTRARVTSFAAVCTEPRMLVAEVPRPSLGPDVRPPAVAGMFYPGTAEEIDRELDKMLPSERKPQPWPGVMVPHAGWVYSGRLGADVLSRVEIPDRVIVLAPKHRPGGSDWAVAPHATWSLPGGGVASDPELARRLAEGVSGLELDATAHAREHAVEVQLPILARLAPDARVLGITLGGGDLAGLLRFGRELAAVLRDDRPRPLLVISSDMNHFAGEEETRRLDRIALDAMKTLDPERLYRSVRDERISMCGMHPAVIAMATLRAWGSLSKFELAGYTTSAETSGDTGRVVGYAGVLLG